MSDPIDIEKRTIEKEHKDKKGISFILIVLIILVLAALFFYVPYRDRSIKENQIKEYLTDKYGFIGDRIIIVEYDGSYSVFDNVIGSDTEHTEREHKVKYEGIEFVVKEKAYGSVSSYEDNYEEFLINNQKDTKDSGEDDE